jgi:hypothetical protein
MMLLTHHKPRCLHGFGRVGCASLIEGERALSLGKFELAEPAKRSGYGFVTGGGAVVRLLLVQAKDVETLALLFGVARRHARIVPLDAAARISPLRQIDAALVGLRSSDC